MAKGREHLDGYVLEEDGSYSYEGSLWRWEGEQARQEFLMRAWRLLGLALMCLASVGFLPAPGGYAFYSLIPYAAAVVVCALTGLCLARMGGRHVGMESPLDLPDHIHARSAAVLSIRAGAAAVACAVSAVGEVVHIVLDGMGEGLVWRIFFAIGMVVAAVALWLLRTLATDQPLEKLR